MRKRERERERERKEGRERGSEGGRGGETEEGRWREGGMGEETEGRRWREGGERDLDITDNEYRQVPHCGAVPNVLKLSNWDTYGQ